MAFPVLSSVLCTDQPCLVFQPGMSFWYEDFWSSGLQLQRQQQCPVSLCSVAFWHLQNYRSNLECGAVEAPGCLMNRGAPVKISCPPFCWGLPVLLFLMWWCMKENAALLMSQLGVSAFCLWWKGFLCFSCHHWVQVLHLEKFRSFSILVIQNIFPQVEAESMHVTTITHAYFDASRCVVQGRYTTMRGFLHSYGISPQLFRAISLLLKDSEQKDQIFQYPLGGGSQNTYWFGNVAFFTSITKQNSAFKSTQCKRGIGQ